ncbi:Uncharacterised protein [uncultured Clostridium sp.]|uniref:hypothetical protein n=1 Tax=uncultured Clostridium sp. TaxID=59620 RepID=UPI000820E649|nr:hypothetical protein [uncultured Clostridium sp.]SCK03989.1 Uncharacterised protein [uncultured Clostridium sp.]
MENLKPLSDKDFKELITIRFNNISDGFNMFSNGILECVDHTLSLNAKEHRFLRFFRDALLLNSNHLIVDFYLKNLSSEEILNLLDSLDHNNKIILIQELKNLKDDSIYFTLTDNNLLDFITILNTRALFFCTLYFNHFPFTIWGNYDLKFPVFFSDINILNQYKDLAKKHGLSINLINMKKEGII